MIELKSKTTRILLDAGYPLFYHGDLIDDAFAGKPYEELLHLGVIPRVRGLYRWDQPAFDAVLISHAHSDHFGLLRYIHPAIPICLSETADKLIEMNLTFPVPEYSEHTRRLMKTYERFTIGDFTIKPYLMDHSAYHSVAFEVKCEGKTVLYTGDFRGHGRRGRYLEKFFAEIEKEPDLLLIEGTTLGRTGESKCTEEELEAQLKQVIKGSGGIVLCQPASQNIDRIISFYRAARVCGKIFVMDIYSANLLYELQKIQRHETQRVDSHEPGITGAIGLSMAGGRDLPVPSFLKPDIRVFYPIALTKKIDLLLGKKYTGRFHLYGITKASIRKKQKQIVMLVRPSTLPDLKMMKLKEGNLIYSMWRIYREKPYQVRLEDYLESKHFDECYLHTSGHAFEEDIKKMIETLSPKEIVPIHTFYPEEFLRFSQKVSLQRDGIPFDI